VTLQPVPYEPAQQEALFALMDRVWGSHMPAPEFDWWFEDNPVGERLVTLMQDEERVVGVAAMSYFRMILDGDERQVAMPVHVATDPDYRRRGIFPALEAVNEAAAADAGSPVTLTFPNAASHPIFVGPLGWDDLPRRRLWARVLRPAAVPRYFLRRPGPPGGLREADPAPRESGDVRVEPLSEVGAQADELWRAAAPAFGNHLVKDAAYLNWRFARAPREYRLFGAFRGERLVGLAVLGYAYRHGVAGGFLADLIAPPRERAATLALLRRVLADVRGGADALIALPPPGRAQRSAFLHAGFLPTHKSIRFIGKRLRPEGRLEGRWHFALGDFDFF
jgi:GNAT superfamily N-acetyltransferase